MALVDSRNFGEGHSLSVGMSETLRYKAVAERLWAPIGSRRSYALESSVARRLLRRALCRRHFDAMRRQYLQSFPFGVSSSK